MGQLRGNKKLFAGILLSNPVPGSGVSGNVCLRIPYSKQCHAEALERWMEELPVTRITPTTRNHMLQPLGGRVDIVPRRRLNELLLQMSE